MERLNEVTFNEIERLSPIQLTVLLKKLLHLEALKFNIPLSNTYVSSKIEVPDGGEDGRIRWDKGPSSTDWIPKPFTLLQCKATKMTATASGKEILIKDESRLKPRVEEVLDAGGAYILFTNKSRNTDHKKPLITAVRQSIKKVGKSYADTADIKIYDSDDIAAWVNQYIAAVTYVCECSGLSLPLGLKTWDQFSKLEALSNKFFTNEQIETILSHLRSHLTIPQNVIRLMGLSGLGKTRLILEAFRPPSELDNNLQQAFSSEMVYFDASFGENSLPGLLANFVSRHLKGIIVVDNCGLELHKRLVTEVKSSSSKLAMITVDYDLAKPSSSDPIIPIEGSLYNDIIKEMLRDQYKELSERDIERIAEFAQGFPHMAVLLAKDRQIDKDTIGYLSDDDLLNKLLWGRKPKDSEALAAIRACAIFDYFGYQDDVSSQRNFIGEQIASLKQDRFYEIFVEFADRGIIELRGRFARVKPLPLAVRLAADWWKNCRPEKVPSLLTLIVEEGLAERLCDQMSKLHFLPAAQEMVKQLCGEQAPFGQAEVLNTEQGSRLFRSLVEVNPETCVIALDRVFGHMSILQLHEIGPGRRNIVWSLEKLCFWSGTFSIAAKLMLIFGAAENETWGNNATNQFLQLFHIYLSGTQAPPDDRLHLIRNALQSETREVRELAIRALGSALQTGHFSRMGGVEQQGSRPPLEEWKPKTWDEILTYWKACLSILSQLICDKDSLENVAREQIVLNMRGLMTHGLTLEIELIISRITENNPQYWPEALNVIKETLRYHREEMPPDIQARLETMISWLTPCSLEDRIKYIVTEPMWEHSINASGHYDDVSALNAKKFAEELVASNTGYSEYIPFMLVGEQRQAYAFGRRLGELIKDKEYFLLYVISSLKTVTNQGNPSLLGGFLSSLTDRQLIEMVLDKVAVDDQLFIYLLDITRYIMPQEDDLKRVMQLVDSQKIPVKNLSAFSYGSVLDHLPPDVIDRFCRDLIKHDIDGLWCALNIVVMYCFNVTERWEGLRNVAREILTNTADLLLASAGSIKDGYHWQLCCEKILLSSARDPEIASSVCKGIIAAAANNEFARHSLDYYIKPVIELLLVNYCADVFPLLGAALIEDNPLLDLNLQFLLGSKFDHDSKKKGPFFSVPDDVLIKWCEDNEPVAPRIIAEIMPLSIKEGGIIKWYPLAKKIIDRFGEDEKTLQAILSNFGTFSWMGSLIPYYQLQLDLLKQLFDHPIEAVAKWAKKYAEWCSKQISQESMRDAESSWGIM